MWLTGRHPHPPTKYVNYTLDPTTQLFVYGVTQTTQFQIAKLTGTTPAHVYFGTVQETFLSPYGPAQPQPPKLTLTPVGTEEWGVLRVNPGEAGSIHVSNDALKINEQSNNVSEVRVPVTFNLQSTRTRMFYMQGVTVDTAYAPSLKYYSGDYYFTSDVPVVVSVPATLKVEQQPNPSPLPLTPVHPTPPTPPPPPPGPGPSPAPFPTNYIPYIVIAAGVIVGIVGMFLLALRGVTGMHLAVIGLGGITAIGGGAWLYESANRVK